MTQDNDKLVLVDKESYAVRNGKWANLAAAGAVGLLVVSLVLTLVFPSYAKGELNWSTLPGLLLKAFMVEPGHFLMLIVLIGYLIYLPVYRSQAAATERLILSKEGIRYISPFSGSLRLLKPLKPDWNLSWSRVSKIEFITAVGAVLLLELRAGERRHRILPVRWINPETYRTPTAKAVTKLFKPRPNVAPIDVLKKAVLESEVVRYLVANAPIPLDAARLDSLVAAESLERDSHGRVAIFLVLALLGYAIIDITVGPESYVDDPVQNAGLYIATAFIGMMLSGLWLSRSALSTGNKAGLAVFIGMMAGAAMIPGALRINTAMGKDGDVSHSYRVIDGVDGVVLQPLEDGWPAIHYFAKNDYWKQFGKDDVYPVRIRKGVLGFYQFDSASIIEGIRQYSSDRGASLHS